MTYDSRRYLSTLTLPYLTYFSFSVSPNYITLISRMVGKSKRKIEKEKEKEKEKDFEAWTSQKLSIIDRY